MNLILRLLSPMLFSLVRRFGTRLAGLDPERVARSKRRLAQGIVLAVVGFVLVAFGLLLTLVDLAVQYEQRGFVAWNPVLWVCVGALAAGLATFAWAWATLPGVRDFVPFAPRPAPRSARGSSKDAQTRPPRRPEYAH